MAEHVKVRLKVGSNEIEIEAARKDVDELLAEWWIKCVESDDKHDVNASRGLTPPTKRRSTQRGSRQATVGAPEGRAVFDVQPTINEMREHKEHDMWESRVLHSKSAINKIKLVCWFCKKNLTTGEIQKILAGLGVKIGLPNVSNAIKAQLSDFLQDGARTKGAVVRYRLTGRAEKEFERWLTSNG